MEWRWVWMEMNKNENVVRHAAQHRMTLGSFSLYMWLCKHFLSLKKKKDACAQRLGMLFEMGSFSGTNVKWNRCHFLQQDRQQALRAGDHFPVNVHRSPSWYAAAHYPHFLRRRTFLCRVEKNSTFDPGRHLGCRIKWTSYPAIYY